MNEMNVTAGPAIPSTIDEMVDQYVKLRDAIKKSDDAHKVKMRPSRDHLERLNSAIVAKLSEMKTLNVKTKFGTAYQTIKKNASISDGSLFRTYVIDHALWDMADWRANATAVEAFILENNGVAPPGVNYSTHIEAGVRRA